MTHKTQDTDFIRGQLPTWWTETTLGEAVGILDWDRGSNYPNWTDFSSDWFCLFLNTKNVQNTQFSFAEKMFISEEKDNLLRKWKLQRGDFVLTTRGTIGNTAHYHSWTPYDHIRINSGMVILRVNPKYVDEKYFWQYLNGSIFKNQFIALQSWSAVPQLPIKDIKTFHISLPPLPEQCAIAAVLSSFDDKIELLREENKTLEATAQTIFKEWFGKYKVDSELPEGWRVGKIKDFWTIVCGKTPSKDNPDYFGWNTPFIKIPDMHNDVFIVKTEDSLTEAWADSQKNKFVPKGSICVSCIATVGLISITSQDSQTNQQINSIIPNEDSYLEYLYFTFTSMKDKLIGIGSWGSATLNINTSVFSNVEIMSPAIDKIQEYHSSVGPIFEKILTNLYQIQSLSKTRDELLPKLMNGEVRVKF